MFDIILPTTNRSSLAKAIESVLSQLYNEWHLIVVGDGCRPYHVDDPRIEFVTQTGPNNDHGAAARNNAINRTDAPWITYLDDDDIWRPDHLTTIMERAILHPEANMIRTAGQSFSWRHRSPRHKKKVRKLGVINNTDILTVGMAHTRDLFSRTTGWASCDNHDHKLWNDMLSAGGIPVVSNKVTFEFER